MQHNQSGSSTGAKRSVLVSGGVRYQTKDVQRSIAFYTEMLGFTLDQRHQLAWNVEDFARVFHR